MSSEGGPKFNHRVASVRLLLPLPDLFISTDGVRSGVQAAPVEVDPRFQVRAVDAVYARTALSAGLLDAIAAFGQAGQRVDLSVDGQQLVAVGAPKDPDELQAYLDRLAGVAHAIDQASLAPYRITPPSAGSVSTAIPIRS